MARNETHVAAPVEAVWAVLEDPYAYPRWVVGTDRTVEADADWPRPGSKFKVHVALGYHDFTHCEAVQPQRRIVLNTAGGPFGAARAEITLNPAPQGTHVTLVEEPAGLTKPLGVLPPMHWLLWLRNVESLRRFKRIAEGRAQDQSFQGAVPEAQRSSSSTASL
jgi:uncharacterized protein YndB with AHSA1/START domain